MASEVTGRAALEGFQDCARRYVTRRASWSVRVVLALVLGAVATVDAQTPDVTGLLEQIKTADTDQLAVSEEDGRFLRVMVAATGAKHVLEIGGAYGYSAIWMGLGLRETGGRLTSVEFDPARANLAAANIRTAGLSDIVTVVAGDAFAEVPKLSGTFDLVFNHPFTSPAIVVRTWLFIGAS